MNDRSFHDDDDDDTPIRATTVRASKGGGAGKWLLGGLVAVVLGGAGYLAWRNYAPTPTPETQTAYNDPYAADTQHAAPLPPVQNTENPASPDESVAPAAASTTPAATAPRATTRSTAAKPAVPEEVIGITPASATADDAADEDIIVNAPTRPVWSRTPSARRLAALYPVVAQEQGREGEAELHCTVQQSGALDCVRVTETRGFGNAALRVASTFRHAAVLADGRDATGTPVNLRVLFRLPPEDRRS